MSATTTSIERDMVKPTEQESEILRVAADEYHADRARWSRKRVPARQRRRTYLLSQEWHQANQYKQDAKVANQDTWRYKKRKRMRCQQEQKGRSTQKRPACVQTEEESNDEDMKRGDTSSLKVSSQKRRYVCCEYTEDFETKEEGLPRRVRAKLEDSFNSEVDIENMVVEVSRKCFALQSSLLGSSRSSPAPSSLSYFLSDTTSPTREAETASVQDNKEDQAFEDFEVYEACEQTDSDEEDVQIPVSDRETLAHEALTNREDDEPTTAKGVTEQPTVTSRSSDHTSAVPDVFNADGTLKVNPNATELQKMNDLLLGFRQHLCRCLGLWHHPVLAGGVNEVELAGRMQTQAV